MLCVIATVASYAVGIPAERVIEMLPMPKISPLPGQDPPILGACPLRGEWRPVVGLRSAFSRPSVEVELDALLTELVERRRDHIHWISELEASVRDGRPFSLARDPHRCAFGQWYDQYHTENLDLAAHLRLFRDPHAAIHSLADEVIAMCAEGKPSEALDIINAARSTTLARLLHLFDATPAVARAAAQTIGVVVASGEERVVLAVDTVRSLNDLKVENQGPEGPFSNGHPGVTGLAKGEDGEAIMILDVEILAQLALGATAHLPAA